MTADQAKGKVLVVDDNATNCELLRQELEEAGYEVDVALSGGEALEKGMADAPDLFLMDVQMSDMNGFDVCRAIRNNPAFAESRVVFVTAHSITPDMAAEAIMAGSDDFLAKPYTPAVLLARVASQVEVTRLRRRFKSLDPAGKRNI